MKEYFSHDYNSRSNEKIKQLIRKHGYEGYGLYWSIVEDLYMNANALRMDCEGIAYDYRTDTKTIESILNNFDLFENDGEFFWSNSVQKRLDLRNEKSNKAKKSAESRWKKEKNNANALDIDANALRMDCEGNAIKEKERKEKENKGKNIIREDSKNEAHASITPTPQQDLEILYPYETECTSIVPKEKGKGVARARNRSLEEREQDFYNSLIPHLAEYGNDMIRDFFNYWSEPNQQKTKMKFELQKTWSIKGRLATWSKNQSKFDNNGFKTKRQQHEEDLLRLAEDVRQSEIRARSLTREQELAKYNDIPI